MPIEVGQNAPDFELADQHGQTVRLSDFRGRSRVAVVFYRWPSPVSATRSCGSSTSA